MHRAASARLAAEGATIVVQYGHDRQAADKVCAGLAGSGHVVAGADLSEPAGVPAFVDEVMALVRRIDVLVNNAGIYSEHPVLAVDTDEWLASWSGILAVNLVSPAVLCHRVARIMAAQGGAAIRAQSPLERVARPDEIAETACFLAATNAEFLTGGIIDVNGASYLRT